jgi:hypothetical protein
MMDCFNVIIEIISIFISIGTFFLVLYGLKIWKIQLKGENTFKLSLDILRELKLTLIAIDEYRYTFISAGEIYEAYSKHNDGKILDHFNKEELEMAKKYAENDRWNAILEKYFIYEDHMLKFTILINDYEYDLVNNKRFRDYILELRNNRINKDYAEAREKELEHVSNEERIKTRKIYREENEKIHAVLFKSSKGDDIFGGNIEQYFQEINKKLRKYLK